MRWNIPMPSELDVFHVQNILDNNRRETKHIMKVDKVGRRARELERKKEERYRKREELKRQKRKHMKPDGLAEEAKKSDTAHTLHCIVDLAQTLQPKQTVGRQAM
ncbi:hypothetical protein N0V85_000827 [Neurospora sp. IMI 360204]|nr:hypothetical protein N0V85_000827 [Neurospora sp. IMI 360204]